jgi:MFS family permease
VALIDELWSGVAVSGAPSVEHELALTHRGYVVFAFSLPLVAAALFEAGLALLSDVWGRARLVALGQGALAAALFFTAWTSSPWGLTLGLAAAGAASGVACGAAQALLIASSRGNAGAAMVRWSLYGAVGDVLTPIVTAAAIALGHSYRASMAVAALLVSAQCAVSAGFLSRESGRDTTLDDEPEVDRFGDAFARALGMPRLWAWLLAAGSCTLLDELVIALAALRFHHDGEASAALATGAAVTFSAGSVLGTVLTDRAMARRPARSVLLTSAVLCGLALGALLASSGVVAGCIALFVVGVTCAPHHPIALASAYEELPERPGTVQAIGQLSVIIDVGAPLALGAIADRYGLGPALGCLLLQPLVVAVCALAAGRPRPAPRG